MRVAVLASGSGTLLDAILTDGIAVDLVVVDRRCRALDVARSHDVDAELHERTSFGAEFDREGFTSELTEILVDHGIDLVVMAGYGTVLGRAIHHRFPHRILNTHPALLPSFKGWHAVEAALDAGVKVTGCTVHIATLEMDAGPILAQEAVRVETDDDASSLHERIKAVERVLYPATIRSVLADPSVLDRSPTNGATTT